MRNGLKRLRVSEYNDCDRVFHPNYYVLPESY